MSGPSMTTAQQVVLWLVAASVGLGLSAVLHAGTLASIALVALVGIVIGFGVAATQQRRR
jgi:hypothetical protein